MIAMMKIFMLEVAGSMLMSLCGLSPLHSMHIVICLQALVNVLLTLILYPFLRCLILFFSSLLAMAELVSEG